MSNAVVLSAGVGHVTRRTCLGPDHCLDPINGLQLNTRRYSPLQTKTKIGWNLPFLSSDVNAMARMTVYALKLRRSATGLLGVYLVSWRSLLYNMPPTLYFTIGIFKKPIFNNYNMAPTLLTLIQHQTITFLLLLFLTTADLMMLNICHKHMDVKPVFIHSLMFYDVCMRVLARYKHH